jgi:hypothetical protein
MEGANGRGQRTNDFIFNFNTLYVALVLILATYQTGNPLTQDMNLCNYVQLRQKSNLAIVLGSGSKLLLYYRTSKIYNSLFYFPL